jgi:hypothetical protein
MKRVLASLFLTLPGVALSTDDLVAEPMIRPCVESVVIARIEKVGEMIDYNTEERLVLHSPSSVDIRITRVLHGVRPPANLTIVHQPGLQQGDGMFLLGRRAGEWLNLEFERRVARDRKGRYVVPFFEAPHEDYLAPRGWIPRDYFERLHEIRYDPKSVAWMGEGKHGQPGWIRIEGPYSVAIRGLVLLDLEELLAQRLTERCVRDAP